MMKNNICVNRGFLLVILSGRRESEELEVP